MQTSEINMMIFWGCVAVGAVVYGVIIWSLIAYRKSKTEEDASFHKHTIIEIAWTVIPLLIIIGMTIPAARLLTRLYGGSDIQQDGMQNDFEARRELQIAMVEKRIINDFPEGLTTMAERTES